MTRVPLVNSCDVSECGFNKGKQCHAAGIQVGDQQAVAERPVVALQDPRCDTFTLRPGGHLGATDLRAQVGSCKMETCQHNVDFRCTADAITVGHHASHADCMTYLPRAIAGDK